MKQLQSTISGWWKSTAIRIPSELVKKAGIEAGQTAEFALAENGIIILRVIKSRPNLETLLSKVTPENLPDESDINWWSPQWTEIW
jgi:antitoxin component of MazEF toxin-antitoxin module